MKPPIGLLLFIYFSCLIGGILDLIISILERDKFTGFLGAVVVSVCITIYVIVKNPKLGGN